MSTPLRHRLRPALPAPATAVALVVPVALVSLVTGVAAAAWAVRPVTAHGHRPDRVLPAVPYPSGFSREAGADRPDRPARAATSARTGDAGGSTVVWDTSRGYPVAVEPSTVAVRPHAPYAWLLRQDAPRRPPQRWSPCAPLVVRVNPAGLAASTRTVLRRALTGLQERTGLRVRVGAPTDESVTGALSSRPWTDGTWTTAPHRVWAPVLVFGSDAERTPELAGATGGWTHVHTEGGRLVSGVVALDLEDLPQDPRGTRSLRMLLLHELGHLVGLGHVGDPDQVMHPYAVPSPGERPAYGDGDRLGLAVAGRGPC